MIKCQATVSLAELMFPAVAYPAQFQAVLTANPDHEASTWRDLYPFESHYFSLGEQRMHFLDEGVGSPVLMVHGNPTWSFYYRELIRDLRTDFRAIAVDHIGCGLSDKPTDYPYCLSQHIDNLVRLIDHLQLQAATLIAHDWGGAIGLGALLQRREAFKRIVLLNTGAFPPPFIPFRIRVCRWPIIGKIAVQGFNLFARAAVTMATEQPGGLSPSVASGFLAPYGSWNERSAIYQFVRDIPLSASHPTWRVLEKIERELPGLNEMPIRLIWGMRDWCFRPACLDRFVGHWPLATVLRLAGAGHYVLEDAPLQVVNFTRQFLKGS